MPAAPQEPAADAPHTQSHPAPPNGTASDTLQSLRCCSPLLSFRRSSSWLLRCVRAPRSAPPVAAASLEHQLEKLKDFPAGLPHAAGIMETVEMDLCAELLALQTSYNNLLQGCRQIDIEHREAKRHIFDFDYKHFSNMMSRNRIAVMKGDAALLVQRTPGLLPIDREDTHTVSEMELQAHYSLMRIKSAHTSLRAMLDAFSEPQLKHLAPARRQVQRGRAADYGARRLVDGFYQRAVRID